MSALDPSRGASWPAATTTGFAATPRKCRPAAALPPLLLLHPDLGKILPCHALPTGAPAWRPQGLPSWRQEVAPPASGKIASSKDGLPAFTMSRAGSSLAALLLP